MDSVPPPSSNAAVRSTVATPPETLTERSFVPAGIDGAQARLALGGRRSREEGGDRGGQHGLGLRDAPLDRLHLLVEVEVDLEHGDARGRRRDAGPARGRRRPGP